MHNIIAVCSTCGNEDDGLVPGFCERCNGTRIIRWNDLSGCKSFSELRARTSPLIGVEPCRLGVGNTPLIRGGSQKETELFFKDEGRNPSGSLKDRGTTSVIAQAKYLGMDTIAVASTGNAASSTACLAAAHGLFAKLFVPETIPVGKRLQLELFGAEAIFVPDGYDAAFRQCQENCIDRGWLNRSTALNPLTREGKKSCVVEAYEQLDDEFDWIVVPVGDGNILSAQWKGIEELLASGLIRKRPQILGVQVSGSNAISRTLSTYRSTGKLEVTTVIASSLADSLVVNRPNDWKLAVQSVIDSEGDIVEVSDSQIVTSMRTLATRWGLFCEPASAAAYAGFDAHASRLGIRGKVLLLATGTAFKDLKSVEFAGLAARANSGKDSPKTIG